MEFFLFAVVLLIILTISNIIVGVGNDAVNFLNSSIGSNAAPRYVIMIIASLGILAGVTFSSGMMEVARKGIFQPEFFLLSEIMVIFVAVMLTNMLLLDVYNTFGLPTSTTVSIVFELLGAAVAVSLIKIYQSEEGFDTLLKYINTSKALAIILGILLSVIVAFIAGAVVQFITRLIFTFEYKNRLKRYGGIWGGLALSAIAYFILLKGLKGASFRTPEMVEFIKGNTLTIIFYCFLISAAIFQGLITFTKVNILKVIILIGTFALAMAFAANDLVNFIGVPLAGLSSYQEALTNSNPMTMTMEALREPIQTSTIYLLFAGALMVITLLVSKKSKAVIKTELSLGSQSEEIERFDSSPLSRAIVRMTSSLFERVKFCVPENIQQKISERIDVNRYAGDKTDCKETTSFDLLRASVNLMVASAVISFATSLKLPLSTTYVTFMVAMGTSLSDQAWGKDSAVFRVTGVLAVVGGWFLTALIAFTVSAIFAVAIYYFDLAAIICLLVLTIYLVFRNHYLYKDKEKEKDEMEIFNLKKITDADHSIMTTFQHTSMFIEKVNMDLDRCCVALFHQDRKTLKSLKKETVKAQTWANIITANIFKTLRLLNQEDIRTTQHYGRIINSLQEITDCHRDIILRTNTHISNNHKGLLDKQVDELNLLWGYLTKLLRETTLILAEKDVVPYRILKNDKKRLNDLIKKYDERQIERIKDDISKTRLSILFYGMMRGFQKVARNTLDLLEIFDESFKVKSKGNKKRK